MVNPFEELKQERLAKEARILLELKNEEGGRMHFQELKPLELRNRRDYLNDRHEDMVIQILKHLKDAAYPDCEVRGGKYLPIYDNTVIPEWHIGKYIELSTVSPERHISALIEISELSTKARNSSSCTVWKSFVVVDIQVYEDQSLFKCKTESLVATCSLSESDLIKTLLSLQKNKSRLIGIENIEQ